MRRLLHLFTIQFLFLVLIPSAMAGVIVDGPLTHEIVVRPGSSYDGTVLLRNPGEEAEEIKIYQTDYRSDAEGRSFYDEPGTAPRSNTAWMTISSRRFTVSAGESYTVRYTLKVPEDSTLAGTYFSMLMVEPIPKTSGESSAYDPEKTTLGVDTIMRYGIRIISHIEGTGTVQPQIVATELVQDEGSLYLSLDILNSGTQFIKVSSWAELYTEDGELVGKFEGRRSSIFPDSLKNFRIELTEVGKASYIALVVLDCGNNDVFGANFTLQIE